MNKKIVSHIFLFISLFACLIKPVFAEDVNVTSTSLPEVNVYMFRGEGCGYCAKALTWFEEIEEAEGRYFNLITYEVWNDESNKELMDRVANYMGEKVDGVPYILVGKKTFSGFTDEYKEQILNQIHEEYAKNVEERFDALKDINENKDIKGFDFTSYIIVLVGIVIIGFIVVARKVSDEDEVVNYEEIIEHEEDDEAKVKAKKPIKKAKVSSATNKSKSKTKKTK